MITRATLSTIEQGLPKYRSMLAGNPAFSPSSFDSIATVFGTGSASTITFSGIPQTYQHLQIRMLTKDTSATDANSSSPYIRINGATTSVYTSHYIFGDGTTVYTGGEDTGTNAGSGGLINLQPGSGSAVTDMFGVAIVDIHDYTSTTKNKTIRIFSGSNCATTTSFRSFVNMSSSLYNSTSAITSITIYNNNGRNFTSTSQFALYGIKGA